MPDYRVYLLCNAVGRTYLGLSADVALRLIQHNDGRSKWTARHRPWRLAWTSRPMNLTEARRLETRLKRQKGGVGLAPLLAEFAGS